MDEEITAREGVDSKFFEDKNNQDQTEKDVEVSGTAAAMHNEKV
jgi:hypothetical protein